MSENDHIASVDGWVPAEFCMSQQLGADIFSLSPIEEATVRLKYYRLYIVKTPLGLIMKTFDMFLRTLRILFGIFVYPVVTARACGFLNIKRQPNGGILDIKILFMEQKEHLLCNWESRECKHPKIIKGKLFILLLFLLL